jgi:hypothetical protein
LNFPTLQNLLFSSALVFLTLALVAADFGAEDLLRQARALQGSI